MTIIYMLYDNKQSITENAEMPTMKFFRHFLLLLLAVPALAFAQVSFPNGVPDISVEDLAVKYLGGRVSVQC
ncbi:MAG: hypothetical protein FWG81_11295 [Betaproteobacteria bacterium]|nr:hypothetical protein [Betaproteobacteria bacterium]